MAPCCRTRAAVLKLTLRNGLDFAMDLARIYAKLSKENTVSRRNLLHDRTADCWDCLAGFNLKPKRKNTTFRQDASFLWNLTMTWLSGCH
jgi:hypothetical protein